MTSECNACMFCIDRFECQSLVFDEAQGRVVIDSLTCSSCGVCVEVCPRKAIVEKES